MLVDWLCRSSCWIIHFSDVRDWNVEDPVWKMDWFHHVLGQFETRDRYQAQGEACGLWNDLFLGQKLVYMFVRSCFPKWRWMSTKDATDQQVQMTPPANFMSPWPSGWGARPSEPKVGGAFGLVCLLCVQCHNPVGLWQSFVADLVGVCSELPKCFGLWSFTELPFENSGSPRLYPAAAMRREQLCSRLKEAFGGTGAACHQWFLWAAFCTWGPRGLIIQLFFANPPRYVPLYLYDLRKDSQTTGIYSLGVMVVLGWNSLRGVGNTYQTMVEIDCFPPPSLLLQWISWPQKQSWFQGVSRNLKPPWSSDFLFEAS